MFARIAPRLIDNGWPAAIPLIGKKAFTEKWSRYNTEPLEDDQLVVWCRQYPRHNVGLPVTPTITVVDKDILNPVLAETVEQIADRLLGPTPMIRIGMAPKTMRFYRGTDIGSRKAHPIEIFNGSGQVVIYGTHPDTGHPYFWPDQEPLSLSPEDLPIVSAAAVDSFLHAVAALLPAGEPVSNSGSSHSSRTWCEITAGSGKDSVDHPRGGHDDLSNCVALCIAELAKRDPSRPRMARVVYTAGLGGAAPRDFQPAGEMFRSTN